MPWEPMKASLLSAARSDDLNHRTSSDLKRIYTVSVYLSNADERLFNIAFFLGCQMLWLDALGDLAGLKDDLIIYRLEIEVVGDAPRYAVSVDVLIVDRDLAVASGSMSTFPKQMIAVLTHTRPKELLPFEVNSHKFKAGCSMLYQRVRKARRHPEIGCHRVLYHLTPQMPRYI